MDRSSFSPEHKMYNFSMDTALLRIWTNFPMRYSTSFDAWSCHENNDYSGFRMNFLWLDCWLISLSNVILGCLCINEYIWLSTGTVIESFHTHYVALIQFLCISLYTFKY